MNVSGPEGYPAAAAGDAAGAEAEEALCGGFVGMSGVSQKTAHNISNTYLTLRSALSHFA